MLELIFTLYFKKLNSDFDLIKLVLCFFFFIFNNIYTERHCKDSTASFHFYSYCNAVSKELETELKAL